MVSSRPICHPRMQEGLLYLVDSFDALCVLDRSEGGEARRSSAATTPLPVLARAHSLGGLALCHVAAAIARGGAEAGTDHVTSAAVITSGGGEHEVSGAVVARRGAAALLSDAITTYGRVPPLLERHAKAITAHRALFDDASAGANQSTTAQLQRLRACVWGHGVLGIALRDTDRNADDERQWRPTVHESTTTSSRESRSGSDSPTTATAQRRAVVRAPPPEPPSPTK